MVEVADRWRTEIAVDDPNIATAEHVHGRLHRWSEYTLCEQDGDLLAAGSVTLVLDHPEVANAPRPVDCPKCLAWMHA